MGEARSRWRSNEGLIEVERCPLRRRLSEVEVESPPPQQSPPDEAFQQIVHADRIVLSKTDLVDSATAVDTWTRLREINGRARIVPCVRGVLAPSELTDLRAFDLVRVADETDCHVDGREHHGHSHADGCDDAECTHHDHEHEHDHSHDSQHSRDVTTFSLVRRGHAVDPLLFARWVRALANLKPDEAGTVYRVKGVLAIAASHRRLAFHAVADVMERQDIGIWPRGSDVGCKIVFIGKRLERSWFEDSFDATLVPIKPPLRPPPPPARDADAGGTADALADGGLLLALLDRAPTALYRVIAHVSTVDAVHVALTCARLHDALFGESGGDALLATDHHPAIDVAAPAVTAATATAASATTAMTAMTGPPCRGYHLRGDELRASLHLHTLLPLGAVGTYVRAFRDARVQILPSPGLVYSTAAEAEAAGVTWLELAEVRSPARRDMPSRP